MSPATVPSAARPATGAPLALVGPGHMGTALLRGLLRADVVAPGDVTICGRRPAVLAARAAELGVAATTDLDRALARAATVILAVRPADLAALLPRLAGAVPADALVISVLAGVRRARLAEALGGAARVVRAMPNVAVACGVGATALAVADDIAPEHLAEAHRLFAGVGLAMTVPEGQIDAATGVAGSGIAFALVAAEGLIAGGRARGLSAQAARALAVQALAGAAALLRPADAEPAALRAQIASPGGTTAAGLTQLAARDVGAAFAAAVRAAADRAGELA